MTRKCAVTSNVLHGYGRFTWTPEGRRHYRGKGLTKRYGDKTAVDNISFTVEPGTVTGFLGPNGAGKSTTMRMIVGFDRPTAGTVTVNGKPYAAHSAPLHEVGVLLDAKSVHPGRSDYQYLRALASTFHSSQESESFCQQPRLTKCSSSLRGPGPGSS